MQEVRFWKRPLNRTMIRVKIGRNIGRTREDHWTSGAMTAALQDDEDELFLRLSSANVTWQQTYCGRHIYAKAKGGTAAQR